MNSRLEGLIAIALMVGASLIFQVQLKLLANQIAYVISEHGHLSSTTVSAVVRSIASWRGISVSLLAGALFLIWMFALTRLELSFALPLASVTIVFSTLGGALMLGESLTWMRVAGLFLTAMGIGLVLAS